ncbi:MAG: site-specific integrase [Candidatus Melainabacteria bacterium]|nr:site-specific integrase [Candidatus Melainabacteria bacterium]
MAEALAKSSYTLNQELLSYFIDYLNQSDKSAATIANIARDLNFFLDYLAEQDDADIHAKYVSRYITILEDKYKESSFLAKLSSLRQFINWLNLDENPFWKLRVSLKHHDFDYYQELEFSQDFAYDDLLIQVIYELYLSQEELIELKLEDYNQARGTLSIRGRELVLEQALAAKMRNYFRQYRIELARASGALTLEDPLFTRSLDDDRAMTSQSLQQLLADHGLALSKLKRSRIMNMLDQAMSFEEIESKLAIKLSEFYRPFVKDKDYRLARAYKDFHPRS